MYLLSIASAKTSIKIAASYFIPDTLVRQSLLSAAARGVRIELIVPGRHLDSRVVRHASRSRWGPLLEKGIAIYEYEPTMYHCKVMIVDDLWTSVGSTNFDNRSFRLNAEANLNVMDAAFAKEQARIFDEDKKKSTRVTYEMWKHRPLRERVMEQVARLLRAQL
jgi:cardiolipin synthase